jgi:hypothetical protein
MFLSPSSKVRDYRRLGVALENYSHRLLPVEVCEAI